MKRIIILLFLVQILTSCYEDYITDYDYNSVYFPIQYNVRTIVQGEKNYILMGVGLGGVRENNKNRIVDFRLAPEMLNSDTLLLMKTTAMNFVKTEMSYIDQFALLPTNIYSLSDNKFVIKKGSPNGTVKITIDTTLFFRDVDNLRPKYQLPVRITSADADTILTDKSFAIIGLKYENFLYGNYWHGGKSVVKDLNGNVLETIEYYTQIPSASVKDWELRSISPYSVVSDAVGSLSKTNKAEMKITLNGSVVKIESVNGGTYTIEEDGPSYYNQAKLLQDRKIFLNYKYQFDGKWYHATDTLTFRNRIRDGVNEWQDENPENYN
ncbi:hypothetical protein SDC9_47798 [bioreactor metagenome]|uniref:BT-3987-like N-terminal domain-containing protein n=1 Tax=bioreactor metagenome TaxID=1076179 RepID=A0A644WDH6_9ZZZZ|nr:DUF1735 domain-containing protein [Paludibacter sp.]